MTPLEVLALTAGGILGYALLLLLAGALLFAQHMRAAWCE